MISLQMAARNSLPRCFLFEISLCRNSIKNVAAVAVAVTVVVEFFLHRFVRISSYFKLI